MIDRSEANYDQLYFWALRATAIDSIDLTDFILDSSVFA